MIFHLIGFTKKEYFSFMIRKDENLIISCLQVLSKLDGKITANKWFLPLVWAADICARALSEGFIRPQTVRALIAEICHIRGKLTGVMNHDWVSVPLVYTQVVTLAVYFYFTAALIGAQVESLSLDNVAM